MRILLILLMEKQLTNEQLRAKCSVNIVNHTVKIWRMDASVLFIAW